MNMFDKDNELSMLIVKQLAKEDERNRYVWLHIMDSVANSTYENFSEAILCTCNMLGYSYVQYTEFRKIFVCIYKSVFKYCNKAKKNTDKPVSVDWLKEQYIKHLKEKYGDVK